MRRRLDVALGALGGFGDDLLAALLGLVLVRLGRLAGALHDLFGLRARLLQALAVFGEQLVGLLARALGRVDRFFDRLLAPCRAPRRCAGTRSCASSSIVTPNTSSVQTIRPMPGLIRKLPLGGGEHGAGVCERLEHRLRR